MGELEVRKDRTRLHLSNGFARHAIDKGQLQIQK